VIIVIGRYDIRLPVMRMVMLCASVEAFGKPTLKSCFRLPLHTGLLWVIAAPIVNPIPVSGHVFITGPIVFC
jgi:hypothetical protein